jgi:hypothetical protein
MRWFSCSNSPCSPPTFYVYNQRVWPRRNCVVRSGSGRPGGGVPPERKEMNRVPEVTENEVQNWVGTRSFQRGYRYFEDEAILNPRRRGSSLIAECEGSQPLPYRVEIRLGPDGILGGSCSCPAGEGGHCKHAAALLLTWLHEPEMFVEVPDLDQLLQNRSNASLISLIQQMVARHPDLEQLVELSALTSLPSNEPISAELIAQQIRRAFSSAGGESSGGNEQTADNLQPILDLGEDLLDSEDVRNAATVYETLMDSLLVYDDCLLNDEGGDLGQVLAECEQGLQECLQSTQDSELRNGLLRALFEMFVWDIQAGGLGYGDETPLILVSESTLEEKQRIAGWVQSELPEGNSWEEEYQRRNLGGLWLGLMGDQLDDETYLRICRETSRYHDMVDRLLSQGRVEEAQSALVGQTGYIIPTIADLYEKYGYPDLGEKFVKDQPNSQTDTLLLGWQKQFALRHNRPEEALQLAELLLWQAQSLDNYNAVIEAAEQLGQREAERSRVLGRLESAGNFPLLVEIHLMEKEIDLALAALERVNPDIWWDRLAVLRRQVAQAVEIPRPREAIRQYLLLAEELIGQRNRGTYAEAALLLQKIQKLYRGLGEDARWQQIINSLRDEHRRLPAFQEELRRANLI